MNIETTLKRAEKLIKKGELTQARSLIEQVLARFPENQTAKRQFSKLTLSSHPVMSVKSPVELIRVIADKLNREENLDALKLLDRNSNILSQNADAQNLKGIAHSRLGNLHEATKQYEKALTLAPGRSDYSFNLAVNLTKEGKFGSAIKRFQEVISHAPENEDAILSLIQILIDTMRLEEAEAMLASHKFSDKTAAIVSFLWGKLKQGQTISIRRLVTTLVQ